MSVNFSPVFNGWQGFTPSGIPLAGGLVNTYLAGTSTPAATYTTSAGNIANANPITLDAGGRPPAEIWLTSTVAYKFVLTDSLGTTLATYDNITGIVNAPSSIWISSGVVPTFVSATQFTVPGNLTSTFQVGLRIQYTISASQFYGTVTASSFGAGVTTVTVLVDSTPLTSGLNNVNVSQLTPDNSPVPTVIEQTTTFQKGLLTANADQAAVNNLDWYLEQTFTPTWGGATLAGATVYSEQVGTGTRIGNLFLFQIRLGITSVTGLGNARIAGLPYQPAVNNAPILMSSTAAQPLAAVVTVTPTLVVCDATTQTPITVTTSGGKSFYVNGFFYI